MGCGTSRKCVTCFSRSSLTRFPGARAAAAPPCARVRGAGGCALGDGPRRTGRTGGRIEGPEGTPHAPHCVSVATLPEPAPRSPARPPVTADVGPAFAFPGRPGLPGQRAQLSSPPESQGHGAQRAAPRRPPALVPPELVTARAIDALPSHRPSFRDVAAAELGYARGRRRDSWSGTWLCVRYGPAPRHPPSCTKRGTGGLPPGQLAFSSGGRGKRTPRNSRRVVSAPARGRRGGRDGDSGSPRGERLSFFFFFEQKPKSEGMCNPGT